MEVFGVEKAPKEVREGANTLTGWSYSANQHSVTLTLPDSASGRQVRLIY